MLKGDKVVSFNHFLVCPMGIQVLSDVGADVVSIETPDGAYQRHWSAGNIWCDGQSVLHLCANRNKRNIALDLKSEKGKEIALRLIDGADIVAENFRPGVMEKLGFGYEALKARKPSLIYASASGYGPDGPYKERPGQDLLAQALFGLMAITGQQSSGPRPVGVALPTAKPRGHRRQCRDRGAARPLLAVARGQAVLAGPPRRGDAARAPRRPRWNAADYWRRG